MAVDQDTTKRAEASLTASRRFEHVEVLERFASIADPTQILLVIIVDEGPVKVEGRGDAARIVQSGGPHVLFLPLLSYEDGYGFTYGARLALPDPIGPHSRISFPLTWGGDRRAGTELDKRLEHGPIDRLQAGVTVSGRTNPYFDESDDRVRVAVRAERAIVGRLRAGVTGSWQRVSFMDTRDRLLDGGVDLVLDTRLDPLLPRNAVFARAAWDRVSVTNGIAANHTVADGRVYIGLFGSTVVVLHGLRDGSNQPLPPYLEPLLGGMETLRGFEAGYRIGDTLVAASSELRVPLSSPLRLARLGVSAFFDVGTVYPADERLSDQRWDRGAGGGVWLSAAVVRLSLDVAHGVGGSTRVHFGTAVAF